MNKVKTFNSDRAYLVRDNGDSMSFTLYRKITIKNWCAPDGTLKPIGIFKFKCLNDKIFQPAY